MCPHSVVRVEERRQYRPHAVDLAVVLVRFSDDEEDWEGGDGECKRACERVGGEIEVFECCGVGPWYVA